MMDQHNKFNKQARNLHRNNEDQEKTAGQVVHVCITAFNYKYCKSLTMSQPNPTLKPEFRGIFGPKGDSQDWLDAVSKFPNGVPRFNTKQEAIEFMTEYNTYHGGSNPEYPHLMHIFTMLVSWEQIETILLPAIEKARKERSFAKKVPRNHLEDITSPDAKPANLSNNIYEQPEAYNVIRDVKFRLNLPIHKCTSPVSTMNTLKYLFFHMKCGIFVMIRDGKLRIFAPFVNGNYRNVWGDQIKVEGDGSLDAYYAEKQNFYRQEQVEPDKFLWWANGNIICNELSQEKDKDKMQYWGDHFMTALRDMLGEACRERDMPDCEFFLNKRDYPQLKINVPQGGIPVEPYGFIYDKDDRDPDQDVPLCEEHKFLTYAPIVSFYAAAPDRFSDIPWPSSEDWEAACGLVFPNTFMHRKNKDGVPDNEGFNPRDLFTEANFRKFQRGWDDNRVATAFFRGTATGGGTTVDNNQRLKVAHLCHEWKHDPEKGGAEPFLDAAIVGWNLRDKKTADGPMNFLRPNNFKFTAGKEHFTPIYEQSKYKYLVYVDGHCAACRYGFMMRLGSVILKVAPRQVADRMWYFDLLQPYVDDASVKADHVPVKADLSDLEEKIRWCRANDEKVSNWCCHVESVVSRWGRRNSLIDSSASSI
jgi:Glycosyl transferase family 90